MTIISKFNGKCGACGGRIKAGETINWQRGSGATHATLAACAAAKEQAAAAAKPSIDLKPVADFLKAAQERGLKSPKLRVLAMDGKTEMRLGITRGGIAPGSISVKLGDEFVGCVRPTGQTTNALSSDSKMQEHLLAVAQNPAKAAKEYAALMGLCSFCGKQLTDAGSVEVGYGPICADKYGLPHKPQGTPALHTVIA